MNTQLVKYIIVSILHVHAFCLIVLPSFANSTHTNHSNTTAPHILVEDHTEYIAQDCIHPDNTRDWHFDESDLTPNKDILWGVIPGNRMRYAIHKRPGPPSIRLWIDAGLVTEENKDQEGISDLLVKYFTFSNKDAPFLASARTDFNGNIYAIDLSLENEALLDQALKSLAANFEEALLQEDDLHTLKETLLSTYEIPPPSIDDQRRSFIFSGSQLARKNTLKDLTPNREVLKNFIRHWYSPDRAVLLITGNVSLDDIILKIEHHFSKFQAAPITYPTPAIIPPEHSDIDAHAVLDPQANFARILFETMTRKPEDTHSKQARKRKLLDDIEEALMQKRFLEITENTEEIEDTCVRFYDHLGTLDIRKIRITTSPQDWESAIDVAVDQLVRIIYKGGFSEVEFENAWQLIEKKHRIRSEKYTGASNRAIADECIETIQKGDIFTNPVEDYDFVREAFKELSVEDCNEELYHIWQTQQCYLIAEGNIGVDNQGEALDALTQAYLESVFNAVRKHKGTIDIPDHFTVKPSLEPYPVAKTSVYEHLGLAQIRYENNFLLNIANSYSDANTVHIAVRFGTGRLNEDLQRPGLGYLAEHIFLESGLAGFDSKTVQTLEQTLGIQLKFEMEEDAYVLRGEAPAEHMLTLLKLLFAYITEPKLSPKAFEAAKEHYALNYQKALESPEGFLKLNGSYHIYAPGNIFRAPAPEAVAQRTLKELKEWIAPVIKEALFELSIVGPFEADDFPYIIDTLNHTFATLSPRKFETNTSADHPLFNITPEENAFVFNHSGDQNQWGARIAWPTCDGWSKLETRRLTILREILNNRVHRALKLQFGDQCTDAVESLNSLAYHHLGCIQATAFNRAEHAQTTKEIILSEADNLAKASRITFDDFSQELKPLLDEFKSFSPEQTGVWEREAIIALVRKKMRAIAEKAMSLVNTENVTYEELKETMTAQVSSMKKAAHYKAALPYKKDALESELNDLKAHLVDTIKSINPNDLTQQETENITLPAINSLIKAKMQIEKTLGMQAQINLKEWLRQTTEATLQQLKILAEENGINVQTPPLVLARTLGAFRLTPSTLPESNIENFQEQFETASLRQAEHIKELINLINEHEMHIYGDVSSVLAPYQNAFLQVAQNLKFKKSIVKKHERTIERKTNILIDNAWELNPSLADWDAVEGIIRPIVNKLTAVAFKLQEHTSLEELLDQAIDTTLKDVWDLLNPHHITSSELKSAVNKLESYLKTKSNTPTYWLNNVLIGSQFYPQKLDWAPHLLSDYQETNMKEVSNIASKYLQRDRAYVIEVFPKNSF